MSNKLNLKARRQIATAMETATGGEVINGQLRRDAGCTLSQFEAMTQQRVKTEQPVKVPCNGCTACCKHDRIMVDPAKEPAERLTHLELEPDDRESDKLQLKHRPDGACVHLDDKLGCTVYDHRPSICRTYDCRVASFFGIYLVPVNGDPEPMWNFDVISDEDLVIRLSVNFVKHAYLELGGDINNIIAYQTFMLKQFGDTKARMRKLVALGKLTLADIAA